MTPSGPITTDQVRGELRRLRPSEAAGPVRVCPRMLKACATWEGPCTVEDIMSYPSSEEGTPQCADSRPVALTSHVMKTLERLLLSLLRPQVRHELDPLQFAYQEKVGVENVVPYLLHRAYAHLDKGSSAVRIIFLYFSRVFNTAQPL